MKLHLAITSPINPPTASPVLTHAQVWAGLLVKCKHPQLYVAAIKTCDVVEESATGLTREVTFTPGSGPPGKVKEVITYFGNMKMDFDQIGKDTVISNIISSGAAPDELYLTFTFSWNFPDIAEGSNEAKEKEKQTKGMGQAVVAKSITTIREMVISGSL